jgi:energy-converting hydrogenase Eha subunit A
MVGTILTSFLRKIPIVEKEKPIVSAWRRTLDTKCIS